MSVTPPSSIPFYREPPKPRPVDPDWTCHQTGDCCKSVTEVYMTREERTTLLPHIPQGVQTYWRDLDHPNLIALKAEPCPFYLFNECTVYPVRPYNCRRFGCLRVDPDMEPFEPSPWTAHSPMGCKNADDRFFTSRVARRMLVRIQHKAMHWARKHGWSENA